MKKTLNSRRDWLKKSLALSVAGPTLGALGANLTVMNSAMAADDYSGLNDYKALVCVFLFGGSDSFNMFIPGDNNLFDAYASSRGSLALSRESLLNSNDGQISFSPQLPALRDMYDAGNLAVMANVGNLIAPVQRSEFLNETAIIPPDLFAHNHQQEQWQKAYSSRSTSLVGSGWGGRMADLLMQSHASDTLTPTLSMSGSSYFLPGSQSTPVSINPVSGPASLAYLDPTRGRQNEARAATLQRLLDLESNHPIKQFAKSSFVRARDSSQQIADVIENSPEFTTPYDPESRLSSQLRMVARMISGRQNLNVRRQIFFVSLGGWDTHDNQTPRLVNLAAQLNEALSSFQGTLNEMAVQDQVTTFTASDFGRTLTVNGDGSDHGWGGHYMVMGGAVNGGKLVGDWPSYEIDGGDDAGDKGRVIPQLSINEYGAAMGSWMGLSNTDLLDVFPDLGNFNTNWQQQFGLFS